jgi:hypothetical protein
MRSLVIVSLGSLLATSALAAQDFRWHGAIASGKTLEIRGINGRITAARAGGGEAEVTASKHARRSDPDEVEIKVVQDEDGVVICALYPSRRGRGTGSCARGRSHGQDVGDNDVTVDFDVRVPAGVEFVGATVNGDVSATGLPADARVSTVNGDVDVEGSGTAEGSTVNGSVTARLGRADWKGRLRFHSVNGGVTVTLPADANVDVQASTVNGSVESDFPVTVQGRMRPQEFHGRVGSGGRDLDLSTVNGSIRLRRR